MDIFEISFTFSDFLTFSNVLGFFFYGFLGCFFGLSWEFFLKIFFRIFRIFRIIFLGDFFKKLLRLPLKVTEVTTENWSKVSQTSIKSSFFAQRAKKA